MGADIRTVGVVGAGTMGAGIAQLALEAGHDVWLHDLDAGALDRAAARIRDGLGRRAARLGLDAEAIDDWVEGRVTRLRPTVSLEAAAGGADLVIEAAIEDLDRKRAIFRDLDRACHARRDPRDQYERVVRGGDRGGDAPTGQGRRDCTSSIPHR